MKKINKAMLFTMTLMMIVVCLCFGTGAVSDVIVDSGECGAEGDNVTWVLYDDGELVISGTGEMDDYHYYTDSPFCYSDVKSIVVGDGVTSIGGSAFWYCDDLSSVEISDSVTSIGYRAFNGCENLASITIPDSVTSIGSYAFSGCKGFTSITIPNSVTSMGDYVFCYCESLISITLPTDIKSISEGMFFHCESLALITIPDTVVSIGPWAFGWCEKLQYISIPDSVIDIGYNAFCTCSSITNITIPDSVTNIGDEAFADCEKLESIIVDNGNEFYSSIDGVLFDKNQTILIQYPTGSDLVSYTIPEGVISIEDDAFARCKLESILIPDSVISIGEQAFFACAYLTAVVIPDNITTIEEYAFCNCYKLNNVIISNSVTSIGASTFQGCYKLTSIIIPNSVTSFGESAFIYCENLANVTIGNSVTSIGSRAFNECTNLTDVYFDGTEKKWNNISIGSDNDPLLNANIHYNCKHNDADKDGNCDNCGEIFVVDSGVCGAEGDNVTWMLYSNGELVISGEGEIRACEGYLEYFDFISKVTLSEGLESICSKAFEGCENLETISIPSTVTTIGSSAFSGCSNLKSVVLNEGLKEIQSMAFSNCNSLEEITFPSTLEKVPTSVFTAAFVGCSNLKIVNFAVGTSKIMNYVCANMSKLECVNIPYTVSEIGTSAFYWCENLTYVNIPDTISEIGTSAFYQCKNLTDVYFEGSEEQWRAISIGTSNEPLLNAKIHYKYLNCQHSADGFEEIVSEENIIGAEYTHNGSYDEVITCDNCGEEISRETKVIPALWLSGISYDYNEGILIINGSSDIPDLDNSSDYPWSKDAHNVAAIYLVGIKSVPEKAFENFNIRFLMIDGEGITIKKNAFVNSIDLWSVVSFCDVVVEEEAFAKTENGTTIYYETGKTVEGNRCVEFEFADGIVHFKGDVKLAKDELNGLLVSMYYRYGQRDTIKALKFNKFESENIYLFDPNKPMEPIEYALINATVYVHVGPDEQSLKRINVNDYVKDYIDSNSVVVRFFVEGTGDKEDSSDAPSDESTENVVEEPKTFFEKVQMMFKGFMDTITYWFTNLFNSIKNQWFNN